MKSNSAIVYDILSTVIMFASIPIWIAGWLLLLLMEYFDKKHQKIRERSLNNGRIKM